MNEAWEEINLFKSSPFVLPDVFSHLCTQESLAMDTIFRGNDNVLALLTNSQLRFFKSAIYTQHKAENFSAISFDTATILWEHIFL
jgi:hypothetical protein